MFSNNNISFFPKSKTNSGLRSTYCSKSLNKKSEKYKLYLDKIHKDIKSVSKKNQRISSLKNYSNINRSRNNNILISDKFKNTEIFFSAKKVVENEPKYLIQQLPKQHKIINLKNDQSITKFDILNGGYYYNENKFVFLMIPRNEIMNMKQNNLLLKAMINYEKNTKYNNCDRGTNRTVYFESPNTNYINFGLGVCRGKKGLYLRDNKKVHKKYKNYIRKYEKSVNYIFVKKSPCMSYISLSGIL